MSKIAINSNVVLRRVKIYAKDGALFADLVGEASSDIGPANFNLSRIQLDFTNPDQTSASAFYFKDGKGRVGYDFNFGDLLYANSNEDSNKDESIVENSEDKVYEEDDIGNEG